MANRRDLEQADGRTLLITTLICDNDLDIMSLVVLYFLIFENCTVLSFVKNEKDTQTGR